VCEIERSYRYLALCEHGSFSTNLPSTRRIGQWGLLMQTYISGGAR